MDNEVVYRLRDGDAEILIEASGSVTSTVSEFRMDVQLKVALDGSRFFERDWSETIPWRLV